MPLKLTRRKGSAHWYIRGTVRGQAVFETTGTADAKAAEAVRIRREGGLLERSIFGAAATVTFLEAANSYEEQGGESRFLGTLDPDTGKWTLLIGHFGATPIAQIGQVEADEAAAKLYPGTSAATRKRQVYVPLKSVLHHAAAKWKIAVARIASPRVRTKPPVWAPHAYVEKLLVACAPKLRLFVTVLVYTGARLEEVMRLDWDEDIDLNARLLTFGRTKNGEMRTAPIAGPLLEALASVPAQARHGRVFHWKHKTSVYAPLKNACKRAGIPYFTTHQVGRHTCATWLRRYARRDLRGLMQDIGWKSINSAVRYAHVVPGESTAAFDLLPAVQSVQNPCSPADAVQKSLTRKRKIA